ncbi:MAG: hypothetical protein WCE82_07395 [Halobacteriota archaeon]
MTTITDEFMQQMLSKTKQYCIVILEAGPNRYEEGMEKIIWEHGWKKSFGSTEEEILHFARIACYLLCVRSPMRVTSLALESLMLQSKK